MFLLVFLCFSSRLLGYSAIIGSLPFSILVACPNHACQPSFLNSVDYCFFLFHLLTYNLIAYILSRLDFPIQYSPQLAHFWYISSFLAIALPCGTWWRLGCVDSFQPDGRGFDSRSSRHVGTLGKSFTYSCMCASA